MRFRGLEGVVFLEFLVKLFGYGLTLQDYLALSATSKKLRRRLSRDSVLSQVWKDVFPKSGQFSAELWDLDAVERSGLGLRSWSVFKRFPRQRSLFTALLLSGRVASLKVGVKELAAQLSARDHALFSAVTEAELCPPVGRWGSRTLQPHVMELVEAFNTLSHFVTATLVESDEPGRRIAIRYFVRLIRRLKRLHSFHSLIAVISGFANAAVRWFLLEDLQAAGYESEILDYVKVLEPMEGWPRYLSWLAAAGRRPLVPFLPAHLASFAILHDARRRGDVSETQARLVAAFRQLQQPGVRMGSSGSWMTAALSLRSRPDLSESDLFAAGDAINKARPASAHLSTL